MLKKTKEPLGTFSLLDKPFGQRTRWAMTPGVWTHRIGIRPVAQVDIAAGGGTSGTLINRGSLLAQFRKVVLTENGSDRMAIPGPVAKLFAEMFAPRPLNDFARLANGDVQANTFLHEYLPLNFALPLLRGPHETAYAERDPNKPIHLEIETYETPYGRWIGPTGNRVLTFDSFDVEVVQEFDRVSKRRPFFVPRYVELASFEVTGAVVEKALDLEYEEPIVALVIQEEADEAEVSDIITRLQLRSAHRAFQERPVSKDFLEAEQQAEFGGGLPVPGFTVFHFAEGGALSNMLTPGTDPKLRLVVDATPSAGATTSQIRVWALHASRLPGVTVEPPFRA